MGATRRTILTAPAAGAVGFALCLRQSRGPAPWDIDLKDLFAELIKTPLGRNSAGAMLADPTLLHMTLRADIPEMAATYTPDAHHIRVEINPRRIWEATQQLLAEVPEVSGQRFQPGDAARLFRICCAMVLQNEAAHVLQHLGGQNPALAEAARSGGHAAYIQTLLVAEMASDARMLLDAWERLQALRAEGASPALQEAVKIFMGWNLWGRTPPGAAASPINALLAHILNFHLEAENPPGTDAVSSLLHLAWIGERGHSYMQRMLSPLRSAPPEIAALYADAGYSGRAGANYGAAIVDESAGALPGFSMRAEQTARNLLRQPESAAKLAALPGGPAPVGRGSNPAQAQPGG